MRPVRAGSYRCRIIIQQVTETRDAVGGVVESWATYLTAWAKVTPLRGREYFESAERQAEIIHLFELRHRDGVTAKMRISWDSRTFNILSTRNIEERDRKLEIEAREVV